MSQNKRAVDQFLTDAKMHPDGVDLTTTVDHLMADMARGLNGQNSSLPMIPNYMDADNAIPTGKRAVVLDAGGTNLRAALVSFGADGKPVIEDFSKHPMPGTKGEVSREDFFDSLAVLVQPLLDRADRIGFCFSYPTEITEDNDGRLIHFSKEVRAPEVEGRMIGADLRDALKKRGVANPPKVVILNDTVATLLTGKASQSGRDWGAYVGFILGTGTNTCYVESNANIGKLRGQDPKGHQIITVESGTYATELRGEADITLGDKTAKPDTFWFEKMISGGYFGSMVGETLALASKKGLFSDSAAQALAALGVLSTKDSDNYAHNPCDAGNPLVAAMKEHGNPDDAQRLWHLVDALLERAAKLTAVNLAAAVLKGEGGENPLAPVCLTIDGTTYYLYYRFQLRVEAWLRPFLVERGRYYETVRVEDAPLIGAAVAALTN